MQDRASNQSALLSGESDLIGHKLDVSANESTILAGHVLCFGRAFLA